MASRGVSILKFVGTVSLGLLTGVSFTVSSLSLPALLRLPSSSDASHALINLTASLKLPVLALTTFAATPLLLSFALSPRSARHPYLIYTSLLAVLSTAVPAILPQKEVPRPAAPAKKPSQPRARMMESSYEVLGDASSEAASEEEDVAAADDVNGEEVRMQVDSVSRSYKVRAGLATIGFAMAVLGIWGDGAPRAMVYVA